MTGLRKLRGAVILDNKTINIKHESVDNNENNSVQYLKYLKICQLLCNG